MNRASLSNEEATTGSIDNRMIHLMRLVLASSALLIIYLDPTQPDRFVLITYGALILYTLYSAILLAIAIRHRRFAYAIERWSHWADVAWYMALIALSSGTSSIFFFFFFFAILVASFQHGFASGLKVAVVSSLLFTVIGYLTATPMLFNLIGYPPPPHDLEFELNRFLLRPIYMLVIGYMMAYWGGREIMLKRRLALLKDITRLSNPRFGVNRTIGLVLERARAFYDAETCALIMRDLDKDLYRLYRAGRRDSQFGTRVEELTPEMAKTLLALPSSYAAVCNSRANYLWPMRPSYYAYDTSSQTRKLDGREICQRLTTLLGAESLATIPLPFRNEVIGRVYLLSNRRSGFDRSDTDFMIHVLEQVTPVIENIRLVDRLASDAAEQERQRIARDLHDSVIQPYIGLQIGLAAIQQSQDKSAPEMRNDIARLADLTDMSIADLRQYIRGLTEKGKPGGSLVVSVRRFATKFTEATGIAVSVEAKQDIRINDRLAAEAFQIIAEGLSNIRRHSHAREATVRLGLSNSHLTLEIENQRTGDDGPVTEFKPRSISDRASALGGQARVEQNDLKADVIVEIPL